MNPAISVVICFGLVSLAASSTAFTQGQDNARAGVAHGVTYFRSDLGVGGAKCGPLPDDFEKPGALLWKVAVDPGQSTPIIGSDRLFLTTYRSEDKELATVALDKVKGNLLWKKVLPATQIEEFHAQMGSAAAATPAFDGERLYAFFGSYGLVCYNLEGHLLWENRMGPFRDEYGAGSSPIVVDDKVILCQDHDTDSFLLAVDRFTGKTVWKVPRPEAVRSYATPVVWRHDNRLELLVAGSLELAGYDPANGRKLWWSRGLARIVIPAPIPSGNTIFMASWAPGGDAGRRLVLDLWPAAQAKWDKDNNGRLTREEIDDKEVLDRFTRMDLDQSGDLDQKEWERHAAVFRQAQNAALAISPSGAGELKESSVIWKYQRGVPYVATPVLDQGILWLVKDGGIVTKLDSSNGELLQEERLPGPGNYYASPVAGDGKVYFASEQGVLSVIANQREWKVLSHCGLHEKIYATPQIDRGRIYIRTLKTLYCFAGN